MAFVEVAQWSQALRNTACPHNMALSTLAITRIAALHSSQVPLSLHLLLFWNKSRRVSHDYPREELCQPPAGQPTLTGSQARYTTSSVALTVLSTCQCISLICTDRRWIE